MNIFVTIQRGFGQNYLKLKEILSLPLEFYRIASANLFIINQIKGQAQCSPG